MDSNYKDLADDYFVNLNMQTTMPLPNGRETVLHFCETVQKEFPDMTMFFQRESGEFVLEGDRDAGSYRWMEIHPRRLCAGYFNPPSPEDAYRMHRKLLERANVYLGISGLDIEALDVMFGFNLDYQGNRDAIVSHALLAGSPLGAIVGESGGAPIEFEPNLVVAVDSDCYIQARLAIETRCNSYQIRTGKYDNEPISVYFTVRAYPRPGLLLEPNESFGRQAGICEDLLERLIVPNVIRPVATAIATGQ